jgi:hypothetical protein
MSVNLNLNLNYIQNFVKIWKLFNKFLRQNYIYHEAVGKLGENLSKLQNFTSLHLDLT